MITVDKLTDRFLQRALKQGVSLKVRIEGSCMEPLIQENSLVSVEGANGLRVGSVVLFQDQTKRYLVHRVVGLNPESVITCGDRNHVVDKPVPYSSILGMIRSVPDTVQTPYNIPEIIAYVSPQIDVSSVPQTVSNGISVTTVSHPSTLIKDLQAESYYTVVIHRGAKRTFHSVPSQISKIAVFIGFEPSQDSTNHLEIDVNDVNLVARTEADWWQHPTLDENLKYLKGFQDGRATNNGLGHY